jgi:hypothetical protein
VVIVIINRDVTANGPDVIMKNETERENMHVVRFGDTCGQKCAKGSTKEAKIQHS